MTPDADAADVRASPGDGSENAKMESSGKKEEMQLEVAVEEGDALDAVLRHVGEMGRYQRWLFLAMLPFGFIFAFVYFVQMFVTPTPQVHFCAVPELQHLPIEMRRNLSGAASGEAWSQCEMYAANWSQVLETQQPPPADTPRHPCTHGWDFLLEDIPYSTVVSERGWVCEQASYVPLAQAMFFAGAFAGGLLFGWVADTFGRVPALISTNLVGFVGGVASIFTTGLWDFALCRFLVGMSYDSCFMMMYILVLEYVGPRHRTWVANMSIALYFGGGCVLLPWLALWVADWHLLLLITSLPMLLVLIAPCLLPESARWLASSGRTPRAVHVLRRFEKVNQTTIPQEAMDNFIVWSRQSRSSESADVLVRSGPLRSMLACLIVTYMACAIIFDALVRMSESLGSDFFITFTLTSATEIPSIALLALLLDRWGRRWLTCGPIAISGTLSLIAAFLPKGVAQVSLAIMARFCINMSYNATIQWATELLPTGVRASGSSLVHVSGYIAAVLSPYIVYAERVWRPLPLLLVCGIAALGAAAGALLPETKDRPMPQTLADGEALAAQLAIFGKRYRGKQLDVEDKQLSGAEKALVT